MTKQFVTVDVPYSLCSALASILLFAIIATGCYSEPVVPTMPPPVELDALGVFIGEVMGPGGESAGTWQGSDLQVTSDGQLTGTLTLSYARQTFPTEGTRDILFIWPQATYITSPARDTTWQYLGPIIPVFAQQASDRSATFDIDVSFPLPPARYEEGGNLPLGSFAMKMVWYRAYRTANGADRYPPLEVHANIHPANAAEFRREFVMLDFDAPPQMAGGQLRDFTNGGEEPQAFEQWLQENIALLEIATPVPITDSPLPPP